MLVSISEGLCLEGLLGAILFSALADMSAAGERGRPGQWNTIVRSRLEHLYQHVLKGNKGYFNRLQSILRGDQKLWLLSISHNNAQWSSNLFSTVTNQPASPTAFEAAVVNKLQTFILFRASSETATAIRITMAQDFAGQVHYNRLPNKWLLDATDESITISESFRSITDIPTVHLHAEQPFQDCSDYELRIFAGPHFESISATSDATKVKTNKIIVKAASDDKAGSSDRDCDCKFHDLPWEDQGYQKAFAETCVAIATTTNKSRQQKRKLFDDFNPHVPLQVLGVSGDNGFVDYIAFVSLGLKSIRTHARSTKEIRITFVSAPTISNSTSFGITTKYLLCKHLHGVQSCLYPSSAPGSFRIDQLGAYKDCLVVVHGLYSTTERHFCTLSFIRADWLLYHHHVLRTTGLQQDDDAELNIYTPSGTVPAGTDYAAD
ncbi:hypothetical protein ST47_g2848 [Ascochyta rabiei]|uniref:Uncharacterized protein n=1 Tax=Didymella rabiei TaxID=5454 RepID=A0A163IWY4_DIDRA|nr:hypothetical protein ST47_g2848 [Ascochyta rabiei]